MLRRTADDDDPFERVVVANAEQLVIVTAVADPEPRTGFVDRCLVAAYAGGLAPVLCLTKADLADPEVFAAQYRDAGPAGAGDPPRSAAAAGWPSCSPGGCRRWSGTPGWASRRWSTRWCRTRPGPSAGVGGRQGPAHHRRRAGPAAAAPSAAAAGWSTPRASARSGWPTSPRTTSRRRSTTWPRPSRTARAAAGTSARRPTRNARWTRWSPHGRLRPGPARRAAPGPRRPALTVRTPATRHPCCARRWHAARMSSGEQPPIADRQRRAHRGHGGARRAPGRRAGWASRSTATGRRPRRTRPSAADLAALFTDLPAPHPKLPGAAAQPAPTGRGIPAVSRPERRLGASRSAQLEKWGPRLVAASPVLALLLFLVTRQWWVFLLIPLVGALVFGGTARRS